MSSCRFTNRLALWSPSAFAEVWLCLREGLHASKLIFGPHAQLLPLQSIKLTERHSFGTRRMWRRAIQVSPVPGDSAYVTWPAWGTARVWQGLCSDWGLPVLPHTSLAATSTGSVEKWIARWGFFVQLINEIMIYLFWCWCFFFFFFFESQREREQLRSIVSEGVPVWWMV